MAKSSTSGQGRPKGAVNKENRALRELILEALEKKGGAEYLARQADENPAAFMTLLGKVLPLQVSGQDGGPVAISFTWRPPT